MYYSQYASCSVQVCLRQFKERFEHGIQYGYCCIDFIGDHYRNDETKQKGKLLEYKFWDDLS